MQVPSKKVQGGEDTVYNFKSPSTKWLVCVYGGNGLNRGTLIGNVERWEQLPPDARSCQLKTREVKRRHGPSDWTASATCK